MNGTLRRCEPADLGTIAAIVNDAANAYRGVIPEDCWHEPYMTREHLAAEIADGVIFWGHEDEAGLLGVMGVQDRGDVCLIRHAYVRTAYHGRGIGSRLLRHLEATTTRPVLVGTWKAATWAIRFYQRHGYRLLGDEETGRVLPRYWRIPARQIETSVVLADARWPAAAG